MKIIEKKYIYSEDFIRLCKEMGILPSEACKRNLQYTGTIHLSELNKQLMGFKNGINKERR